MVKFFESTESEPRLIALNQIEVSNDSYETSKADARKVSQFLKDQKFNVSLPIVCLTEEEDRYHLLTGLAIFEAARLAEIPRIWVFLIAATKLDASNITEQFILESRLNQAIFDLEDLQKFANFINKAKESELVEIPGIKEKYAQLIQSKRPFNSPEDIKKLGSKRSLQWLQAYIQKSRSN
jgi:hypothetical protein